jgi:hypothetical protein
MKSQLPALHCLAGAILPPIVIALYFATPFLAHVGGVILSDLTGQDYSWQRYDDVRLFLYAIQFFLVVLSGVVPTVGILTMRQSENRSSTFYVSAFAGIAFAVLSMVWILYWEISDICPGSGAPP